MNTKLILAGLILIAANTLRAAGVNWVYQGSIPYDTAIIVWTDEDLNNKEAEADIIHKRNEVIVLLAKEDTQTKPADIASLCARIGTTDGIKVSIVSPITPTRVHHGLYYGSARKGWGFSLLVNKDSKGYITEYAINQVTSAEILSEIVDETQIVIADENLDTAVAGSALTRLLAAQQPVIVNHDSHTGLIEEAPQPETRIGEVHAPDKTICFDITNAVCGFTYHVIASDNLAGPFTRCGVNAFAKADGRLSFTVGINPEERIKFYRVETAESTLTK